jgi:alpha-glucosidase
MGRLVRQFAILALLAVGGSSAALAQGWQHVEKVQHVEKLADGVEITAGSSKVRITSFRDGIIRVRLAPGGAFAKDFSWAIAEPPAPTSVQIDDGKSEVTMTAGSVTVVINKDPLLIHFADAKGNTLVADEPARPMAWDGKRIRAWKQLPRAVG